ncbi:MAG: 30S ribosomal protein S19e [Candidatus Aenigmatarchaeota archaeon]
MAALREIDAGKMVKRIAEELKNVPEIKPHKNVMFVKTGVSAERPAMQADFWYLRAAAILRKAYLNGPVGTQRLRTAFGGKRNRGHKPSHHRPAGGKFIRMMLQQLDAAGLIHKVEKPKKGRMVTPKGQKFLEGLAKGM